MEQSGEMSAWLALLSKTSDVLLNMKKPEAKHPLNL
jgi:hypothetical protein